MLLCIQSIQNESDRSLVENLYHQHYSTMLYIAQSILKDQYRAEDAVSQSFIKIIDSLQKFSFENCNKTRGLVVIIVRNVCYNMIKSDRVAKSVPLEDYENVPEEAEDTPLDYAISAENYDFVIACISNLNTRYKDLLTLKLLYDYADDEISKILEISQENVRVRFHRARIALIEEMRKGENSIEQTRA